MIGGTWLTATLVAILACTLAMVVMTARLLFLEQRLETRVWVSSDFDNGVEITTPTVQGVPAVIGQHVVMGVAVVMSIPEVCVGRTLIGHGQELRATAIA